MSCSVAKACSGAKTPRSPALRHAEPAGPVPASAPYLSPLSHSRSPVRYGRASGSFRSCSQLNATLRLRRSFVSIDSRHCRDSHQSIDKRVAQSKNRGNPSERAQVFARNCRFAGGPQASRRDSLRFASLAKQWQTHKRTLGFPFLVFLFHSFSSLFFFTSGGYTASVFRNEDQ